MSGKPLASLLLSLTLAVAGCGGSMAPQLESISITPTSASGAAATYTATGTLTNGKTITPLPVSWLLIGPGFDPAGPTYALVKGPFLANRCSQTTVNPALNYTVVAFASANPNATSTGPMSNKIFEDLVITHTVHSEGGFVAATAALTCP